jgi:signal transduction histidine kinase
MKLKLFKKFFFITTTIIVISLTVMMMILSMVLNYYISRNTYKTLSECCEQVAFTAECIENNMDEDNFLTLLRTVANVSEADIFMTDGNGAVLVCSCNEWQENKKCLHSSYIVPKDIIEKAEKEDDLFISTIGMYKFPQYVASRPINASEPYYVFATSPPAQVKELMATVSKIYFLLAILPIVIMFFAIYAMTYRLTKPLKSMSEAAKAMAKGDFSKRIPVTSDDEIGELAVSFNMMTNSLAQLEGMRRSFVGNVSHELKTPMTTIGGFIDGILDGTIPPERQSYYLDIVAKEVKRLSRLVEGMLSMSRLESGQDTLNPQTFDFSQLLCTIVIGLEQRIEQRKLEIIGLDSIKSVNITADKDLIHQAVYNLVDNAIKFTNKNGKIEFTLSDLGENIVFRITNTGNGIREKELPLVFERFYKGDKSRSDVKDSTGIGLYIVKTIVSSHKGNISVTSKENEFTSFEINLPKEI